MLIKLSNNSNLYGQEKKKLNANYMVYTLYTKTQWIREKVLKLWAQELGGPVPYVI